MTTNSTEAGVAVITGASAGIGAIYADRLSKRGYDLILVARNESRLAQVAQRVREKTGRFVETVVADLGNVQQLADVEELLRVDPRITMLVNSAGIGSVARLLDADVTKMSEMIDVNIGALTRLTYAAAPAFAERGRGTIINLGSTVGIFPEALNGVYGATKAYVLALTYSLQHELASRGLRIQAVLPGATATDFWSVSGSSYENLPKERVMTAAVLVDAALAGLDLGEVVTIPTIQDEAIWLDFESRRKALAPFLSSSVAASRYTASR